MGSSFKITLTSLFVVKFAILSIQRLLGNLAVEMQVVRQRGRRMSETSCTRMFPVNLQGLEPQRQHPRESLWVCFLNKFPLCPHSLPFFQPLEVKEHDC